MRTRILLLTVLAAAVLPHAARAQGTNVTIIARDPGEYQVQSPWNTQANFTPTYIPEGAGQAAPMIRWVCFFNATGGKVDAPGCEIYDEDASGNPIYHFDRLTTRIDTVLSEGAKPYLALSAPPLKLASDPNAISPSYNTNTSPPGDWDKYYDFIHALFLHLNDTYTAQEVASWRYRCMTEPDAWDWWSGTQDEYFRFLDYTVSAARSANPNVVIEPGNLMIMDSDWLNALAARYENGVFSIPGEQPALPAHWHFSFYRPWRLGTESYPTELTAQVQAARARLAPYPSVKDLPFVIDEGYIGVDENDHVMYARLDGTELGGAYFALLTHILVDLRFGWGALWTPGSHEVPPPARNVLDLFEQHIAGGSLLEPTIQTPDPPDGNLIDALAVIVPGSSTGDLRIMLYNYHRTRGETSTQQINLVVHTPGDPVELTHLAIDADHGNYSKQWLQDSAGLSREAFGYPLSPYDLNPLQGIVQEGLTLWETNKSTYQALSQVPVIQDHLVLYPDNESIIRYTLTLPSNGVAFLILDAIPSSEEEHPAEEHDPGTDAPMLDGGHDASDGSMDDSDHGADNAADPGADRAGDGGDGGTTDDCACSHHSTSPPWLSLLGLALLLLRIRKRHV